MGAGHSTPQTARIDNPKKVVVPIEITPSVVSRLEEAQKVQSNFSSGQENRMNENDPEQKDIQSTPLKDFKQDELNPFTNFAPKQEPNSPNWHQTAESVAAAEEQFNATIEKLENIIGKPLTWNDQVQREITRIRKSLIKCYQEHPGETLCCSDVAKKYQEFIFREQYRNILKSSTSDEHQQRFAPPAATPTPPPPPPPPYHHSPPYK